LLVCTEALEGLQLLGASPFGKGIFKVKLLRHLVDGASFDIRDADAELSQKKTVLTQKIKGDLALM